MITLLVVLGSIAAYLLIGALVARVSMPALWARALKEHSNSSAGYTDWARGAVVTGVVVRWCFWPFMGPYELLARRIDAADPRELERRNKEQARRIEELERELGVKP